MARKTILPKRLGPSKIPNSPRCMGNKALADPQVVTILSGALASVGAAVTARKVVQDDPGGAALARHATPRHEQQNPGSVTDVVKQLLEEALQARHPAQQVEEPQPSAKAKHEKASSALKGSEEPSADQIHWAANRQHPLRCGGPPDEGGRFVAARLHRDRSSDR